jgi:RNA polymerase sigma factor (sigma-70 family)
LSACSARENLEGNREPPGSRTSNQPSALCTIRGVDGPLSEMQRVLRLFGARGTKPCASHHAIVPRARWLQHSRPLRRHGGVIDAREMDPDGLEAVYRRLWEPLVRLANLLTGSESMAEDVVHDAFIGFARNAAHVENPDGYLRASVVNLSRTAHRRRVRDRDLSVERITVTHDPEIDVTWAALRSLPVRQRAVLALRFYEDLPFDEIAALVGCRPATARSLARRGLARLKELLDDC